MDKIKVGDIICSKKSVNFIYKLYYTVVKTTEDTVLYTRCPLDLKPTYVYESKRTEMFLCPRVSIELMSYIEEQINKRARNILDEIPFTILVKQNRQSIQLLHNTNKILAIKDRKTKTLCMFEIINSPKIITGHKTYVNSLTGFITREYIMVTLGRLIYKDKDDE
ncbi:hypothetical protein [Sharpea azabuensis]|uniref:hypothetical protein n=1 Tax=Sharpea azabuensis TaxID=322505 RepID=UPI0015680CFB|nr:hypothetical protein [Sharpea azabuensis]